MMLYSHTIGDAALLLLLPLPMLACHGYVLLRCYATIDATYYVAVLYLIISDDDFTLVAATLTMPPPMPYVTARYVIARSSTKECRQAAAALQRVRRECATQARCVRAQRYTR